MNQWISEVKTHAPSLRIFIYKGTKNYQEEIADLATKYDIVFTTYEVLKREIHFARPDSERTRRFERKYDRLESPLIKIRWWRVCLDEAQMIEHAVTLTAQVARNIPRINAWAVTGTPVGRNGLDDLHGLILFLGLEPLSSIRQAWKRIIDPINADDLMRFLRHFMHRNLKVAVESELKLPEQHEHTYFLDFSAIERHYYDDCVNKIKAKVSRETDEVEKRKHLASGLMKLRQIWHATSSLLKSNYPQLPLASK